MIRNRYTSLLFSYLVFIFILVGCSRSRTGVERITYLSSDRQGEILLWSASTDGQKRDVLFPWLGTTREFSWLPDGSGLYVWMIEAPGGKPRNYILSYLGKPGGTCITCNVENYDEQPTPSPDGKRFVIVATVKDKTVLSKTLLYIANKDGSGLSVLVDVKDMIINGIPSWSPDGKYLVFPADVDGIGQDIYRVKSDGSELVNLTAAHRDLTNYPTEFYSPQWSPLGDKIAFLAAGSRSSICTMNIDGSNLIELTAGGAAYLEVWDPASDFPPQWSPDGNKLAFATTTTDSKGVDIFLINADGTHLRNLTFAPGEDLNPVWSPDGQQLAFTKLYENNLEIYVINADGSNPINISQSPDTADYFPVWRP